MKTKYRSDIQVLRGLAVASVVLFHLGYEGFRFGYLGVDVFFVISGYLMAILYDRGTKLDFYGRRIRRLLPAYWITILSSLAVGSLLLVPQDFRGFVTQSLWAFPFGSNFFHWHLGDYFESSTTAPLLNLWSLSVEMQFYLLVPFLYPILRKRKALLWAVLLLSLLMYFAMLSVSPKTSFFITPFRIWEFLFGAAVAWQASNLKATEIGKRMFVIPAVWVAVIFASGISGYVYNAHSTWSGLLNLSAVSATAFAIRYGLPAWFLSTVASRSLQKVGDFSYSIYLIHFPAIIFWTYVPFDGQALGNLPVHIVTLSLISTVLSSIVMRLYVERRFSTFLNTSLARILVVLFFGLSAFGLQETNMRRFSADQLLVVNVEKDSGNYRCGYLTYRLWTLSQVLLPSKPYCELSSESKNPKALLVGDSHANSLKEVFRDVSIEFGWSPLFVIPNDPIIGNRLQSEDLSAEIVSAEIDLVILHYSSRAFQDSSDRARIRAFVETLILSGVEVEVLAPIPIYPSSVPAALWRGEGEPEVLELTLDQHYLGNDGFSVFSGEVEALGLRVVDPAPVFCGRDLLCRWASPSGKLFYFDSEHLTFTGARVLRPIFEDYLARPLHQESQSG